MNPHRSIEMATKAPKTKWTRLLFAFVFRGLNGKLNRHWLRSLTEFEASHSGFITWSNWLTEKSRRREHLQLLLNPLNYTKTKYRPVF